MGKRRVLAVAVATIALAVTVTPSAQGSRNWEKAGEAVSFCGRVVVDVPEDAHALGVHPSGSSIDAAPGPWRKGALGGGLCDTSAHVPSSTGEIIVYLTRADGSGGREKRVRYVYPFHCGLAWTECFGVGPDESVARVRIVDASGEPASGHVQFYRPGD